MKYATQDIVNVSLIPEQNPWKILIAMFLPVYERNYGTKTYRFRTHSCEGIEDLERKREETFKRVMIRVCKESHLDEFTVVRKKKAIKCGRKKMTQMSFEEFTYYRFPYSKEQLLVYQKLEPNYKYKVSY